MSKEKKTVQVRINEGQIKTLGSNLWIRRKIKVIILAMVLCIAWFAVVANLVDRGWLSIALMLVPSLYAWTHAYIIMVKEGNKLWDYVKDKEQPVDLG